MDFLTIIESATPFVGGLATAGALKEPINSLNRIWYNTFGHKSELRQMKNQAKNEIYLEQFKIEFINDIAIEASKIKLEDIQLPAVNIAGPAIQNSEYYLEYPDVRKMFARLIASTMDQSKNNDVHPSFVEVIKQMNSLDAKLINNFSTITPIVQIVVDGRMPENNSRKINFIYDGPTLSSFKNFYYSNDFENYVLNAKSISNLIRLGLIEIEKTSLQEKSIYNEIFEGFKNYINEETQVQDLIEINSELPEKYAPYEYRLVENYIYLTHFGESFVNSCI